MSIRPRTLDGITVVSFEQAVAAPFATRQLADLGARVIKVERPGVGDFARAYDETVEGLSSYFVWLNRSKESIALDLKSEAGLTAAKALVARADVVVQNLAPGAAERLGLGADELRAERPELIHVSVSGYGAGGPYSSKKAYDLLIQCESGLMSLTGTEEVPSKVGISVADIASGMYAYSGILTALLDRAVTGEGATLEVSMLEALGEWMGNPLNFAVHSGRSPRRSGGRHASIAPYGPFRAKDAPVFLGIQNEREWERFCREILEQPDLATDGRFTPNARRVENREELTALIEDAFASTPAEVLLVKLEQAGIANALLRDMVSFAAHPQLEARSRWAEHGSPVGPIRALIPPATLDGASPVMGPVPDVGEHTDSILEELGLLRPQEVSHV